jgi:hypothetical protein
VLRASLLLLSLFLLLLLLLYTPSTSLCLQLCCPLVCRVQNLLKGAQKLLKDNSLLGLKQDLEKFN